MEIRNESIEKMGNSERFLPSLKSAFRNNSFTALLSAMIKSRIIIQLLGIASQIMRIDQI